MDIDSIIEVRLMIADPQGYPIIEDGAVDDDELTAYRVDTNKYYNCDGERLSISVSDSTIDSWVTSYGITKAAIKSLERIIANLNINGLSSMTSGSESMTFASLSSKLAFYNDILDNLENDDNLGSLVGRTKQPIIGGGDV